MLSLTRRRGAWAGYAWFAAALLIAVALVPLLLAGPANADETPSATPSSPPRSGATSTIGIGPTRSEGIDYRPAYIYAGAPGTVIRDQVGLQNFSTKPVRVKVYATDAFTTETGGFDLLPEAQAPKDLGKWTNLRPRIVTIPARSTAANSPPAVLKIPFRVVIPKNATPGDHAAGIVASTLVKDPGVGSTGVIVDQRVGTRMYVNVLGATTSRLEIQGLTATYLNGLIEGGLGRVRVEYTVANTGNTVLSAEQSVRIDGWFKTGADGSPLEDVGPILPGGKVRVSTDVDGVVPAIRGTARVELVPFSGEGENRSPLARITASTGLWMVPWALLILIAVLIVSVWGWRRWRTRRNGRGPDSPASDIDAGELVNA